MKIVFMGTPEFAVASLKAWWKAASMKLRRWSPNQTVPKAGDTR